MRKPKDIRTKIGGVYWRIKFVRKGHPKVPGAYGFCYWHDKEIYIRYDLAAKTVRDTMIHELLHATCLLLFFSEEWVEHTATEINEALHKSGL